MTNLEVAREESSMNLYFCGNVILKIIVMPLHPEEKELKKLFRDSWINFYSRLFIFYLCARLHIISV